MNSDHKNITLILKEIVAGNAPSAESNERLYAGVYNELHRIAAGLMRHERIEHTLQPTALVNEAYLKLEGSDDPDWQGRIHFYGVAARAMRQVLVDHARRHQAKKRGGDLARVTLTDNLGLCPDDDLQVIALHDALDHLAMTDERMAKVVELRIFAGLTESEIARILGFSRRTVAQDWKMAKMWLARELAEEENP